MRIFSRLCLFETARARHYDARVVGLVFLGRLELIDLYDGRDGDAGAIERREGGERDGEETVDVVVGVATVGDAEPEQRRRGRELSRRRRRRRRRKCQVVERGKAETVRV